MKIKNILGLAAATFALLPFVSCVDGNDWDVDSAHNRLFGVNSSKLSVETDDNAPTKATVDFTAFDKSAEYYIIELSGDTLTDEIPMGGTETQKTVIYGEDKSITKAPVELTHLSEYTKYYLRIKAMSSTKPESKWVYYKDGASFRTPGVLKAIQDADCRADGIRLSWIPGTVATHIVMSATIDDELVSDKIDLTADDLAKAELYVSGLKSNKTYTFEIYNGETLLGVQKGKTLEGLPSANYQIILPEGTTELTQDMLNEYVDAARANSEDEIATVAIGFNAGEQPIVLGTEDGTGGLTIPDNVSVTFMGVTGVKPNLKTLKSMKFEGNSGFVSFKHVVIDGSYDKDSGTKGCEYLINQSGACTVDKIEFNNCEIYNLNSSLVRMQGGQTVNNVILNDCIVNNHAGAYAFFCFDKAKTTVKNISLTNSTFSNLCLGKKSFIDVTNAVAGLVINIESCTFYNILGDGAYLISAKSAPNDGVTANINKTLFAKTYQATARGYQKKETVKMLGGTTYLAKDFVMGSGSFADMYSSIDATSSEIFKKPSDCDFTVRNSILQRDQVGDPRWLK